MAKTQNLSDQDESSDSSDSENEDVQVQVQGPVLTAINAGASLSVPSKANIAHKRKIPITKGK